MRYDGHKYRDCRWCGGNGCLYCEAEADKAYKAAFPDGPQPFATFQNTPEGIAAAREVIGAKALEHAFGPEGEGIVEFLRKACRKSGDQ